MDAQTIYNIPVMQSEMYVHKLAQHMSLSLDKRIPQHLRNLLKRVYTESPSSKDEIANFLLSYRKGYDTCRMIRMFITHGTTGCAHMFASNAWFVQLASSIASSQSMLEPTYGEINNYVQYYASRELRKDGPISPVRYVFYEMISNLVPRCIDSFAECGQGDYDLFINEAKAYYDNSLPSVTRKRQPESTESGSSPAENNVAPEILVENIKQSSEHGRYGRLEPIMKIGPSRLEELEDRPKQQRASYHDSSNIDETARSGIFENSKFILNNNLHFSEITDNFEKRTILSEPITESSRRNFVSDYHEEPAASLQSRSKSLESHGDGDNDNDESEDDDDDLRSVTEAAVSQNDPSRVPALDTEETKVSSNGNNVREPDHEVVAVDDEKAIVRMFENDLNENYTSRTQDLTVENFDMPSLSDQLAISDTDSNGSASDDESDIEKNDITA